MIEAIFWMVVGAGGVVGLVIFRLVATHGLAWVQAKIKARAMDAEADMKQKFSGAIGDLDARIKAAIGAELATLKADLAALKAKVGGLA